MIGCNNDPAFVFTTMPGLTSVAYPGRGVGAAAVELLDRMLESPTWQPEGPWLIPPGEVVERSSTAVFDFEDPLIGRVWRWIQDHPPDRPARVADLARALSVAEATLRRRFRRATGKTVKATLDEHRWRRIGEELKRGNDSIKRIAYRFGFTSPEELSRFVKRCTGDSPSLWRSRNRSAT